MDIPGAADLNGVVLVEAKSHPAEMYSTGSRATADSRERIEVALTATKRWLGTSDDCDWTGSLYQYANRLAHLYFFRELAHVPAWLVNVYFLNDSHSPTSLKEWQDALTWARGELGLVRSRVPYAAELFLEAKSRGRLLGA